MRPQPLQQNDRAEKLAPPARERFPTSILIPPARAFIRYVPFPILKRKFWEGVVGPYLCWEPHDFVATTVFGCRIAGKTTDIIQQYIYYFGLWEPQLTYWLREQLAPGDSFVDVGANIGYFSLLASQLVGESGRVTAIEASPTIFSALQRNLDRNRIRNVFAVNVAASDSRRVVPLFRGPDSNVGQTTFADDQGFQFECEVRAAPLAEIIPPEEVRRLRLIKIDVEAAAWSVVSAMGPLLAAARDDLEVVVEVHPDLLASQELRPDNIVEFVREVGFSAYGLETDYSPLSYLAPDLSKRPRRIRAPIDYEADIVFSRREQEFL